MLIILCFIWLQAYKGNKLVRFLGELLIGPLRPEGRWQTLKSPDSRFLRKYGVLFEDNRGPPMVVRGATWEVENHATGYVNRGKLEYHLGRPILSFRLVVNSPSWYCIACHLLREHRRAEAPLGAGHCCSSCPSCIHQSNFKNALINQN